MFSYVSDSADSVFSLSIFLDFDFHFTNVTWTSNLLSLCQSNHDHSRSTSPQHQCTESFIQLQLLSQVYLRFNSGMLQSLLKLLLQLKAFLPNERAFTCLLLFLCDHHGNAYTRYTCFLFFFIKVLEKYHESIYASGPSNCWNLILSLCVYTS